MVHEMDLSTRGPLTVDPFSIRPFESDMDWLRKESKRQGIPIANLVRLILARHVDSQTQKGNR